MKTADFRIHTFPKLILFAANNQHHIDIEERISKDNQTCKIYIWLLPAKVFIFAKAYLYLASNQQIPRNNPTLTHLHDVIMKHYVIF